LKRREFISLVGGAAVARPLAARAQKAAVRIGLLAAGSADSVTAAAVTAEINEGLRDNGMIEGRDYVLVSRYAAGKYERFPDLVAPQFFLHLVHDRPEPEHVSHKNDDANAITEARAFRFGHQLHIQKRLPDSCLITLDQRVGLGVDTAHTGNEDEIARARANIPGSGCLDCALVQLLLPLLPGRLR